MLIAARDLQVGDIMLIGKSEKRIEVKTLERGGSCGGIHVNVVRREAHAIKKNGKVIGLNADRGAIVYSDGCWSICALLLIERTTIVDDDLLFDAALG